MNLQSILKDLNDAVIYGDLPQAINGITADSRKVKEGWAFIAVKGINHDGHDFIPQVEAAGGTLLFTEKEIQTKLPYIRLSDTRKAWGKLMQAWNGNPELSMKVAGITGTNGKTTVSTLVHQALQSMGNKVGLMGTIASKIGNEELESKLTTGDPEQIAHHFTAMYQAGCAYVVMEVSSHALDQDRVSGIGYDVAVFTNISHDHLDYHGSMEAYIQAKKKLFDSLSDHAIAIVNSDDPAVERIIRDCKATIWRFGLNDGSLSIVEQNATGMLIEIDESLIQTPLSGDFNAFNVAAAYLVCRALGCSSKNAANALTNAPGARGRLERVTTGVDEPAVFVDYAHTPDALKNVLKTLVKLKSTGELVVVFGCGGDRDKKKRPEMGRIAGEFADKVIVTSDNPRSENPDTIMDEIISGISISDSNRVKRITDRKSAIEHAIHLATNDDIILIAGKGHENYQEINGIRYPMDDTAIARQALKARLSTSKLSKEGR